MVFQMESGTVIKSATDALSFSLSPPLHSAYELLTWGRVHKLLRILAEQGILNVAATHPTGSCVEREHLLENGERSRDRG